MQTEYSDHDTARARQEEASSAGQPTRQLPNAYVGHAATPAATTPVRSNNGVALALIAVGVMMLLGRFIPDSGDLTGGMVILTIASCFLFFGLWKRIYGLIIPGSILGGLSIGVAFASVTDGVSVLWGIALGFFTVFVLGKALFARSSQWPIYPGVIMFAVGTIAAIANAPGMFAGFFIWLPLLLIVAGLYLGWRRHAY